jgi:hypothetical protein
MRDPNALYWKLDFLHEHMNITSQEECVEQLVAAANVEPSVIVVPDLEYSRQLKREHSFPKGTVFVSVNSLKGLRGRDKPLLFAPPALMKLMAEATEELGYLKAVREALEVG